MQVKSTVKHHLTPVRMSIIKKKTPTNDKYWRRYGEKGILRHYWWEYKLVQSLCKTIGRFHKKLRINLLYDSTIPLLDIYPTENMYTQKDLYKNVHSNFIHNSQNLQTIQMSNKWTNHAISIQWREYLAITKNNLLVRAGLFKWGQW